MSEKALASRKEYWNKCAPAIVDYYNPGSMRCCRDVVCAYYGEPCKKLVNCCKAPGCHPGPPIDLDKKTSEYAKKLAKGHGTSSVQLAKGSCDLLKYDKEMIMLKHLTEWREDLWVRHRMLGDAKLSNLDPPNFITTDHALTLVVSAIHQVTTEEHTFEILDQWIEITKLNLSMEEKLSLIPIVSMCNTHWKAKQDNLQGCREARKGTEAHKRSWPQGKDVDNNSVLVPEPTREAVMEPTLAEVLGQRHTAGKQQIKLTAKAMNADVYDRN